MERLKSVLGSAALACLALGAITIVSAAAIGCEKRETKHDVYMRAMQLEGEAERGDCKLAYDPSAAAHVLDGDQVQSCLKRLDEAIELYDQAAAMGLEDLDFVNARERALQRKQKLEGMLSMVRKMEAPEYKPPALPE